MGRFRKHTISDEQAERLLSPVDGLDAGSPLDTIARELRAAGKTPPSEAVAAQHLTAILAEIRSPRDTAVAAPRPRRRPVPTRLAAGATAFAAMVALAVAGALPGPVQAAASDVLDVVGIDLPDGRDASPIRRAPVPARPAAVTTETTRPADEQEATTPPAVKAPADDRRPSHDTGSGGGGRDEAPDRGKDRDRDDDGEDRDRDDERIDRDEDNDQDAREPDGEVVGDEPDTSGDSDPDDETDNSGSRSDEPESEDSGSSEAPGTSDGSGSGLTDDGDLGDGSEGRSEPDDDAVPDPVDD